MKVTFMDSNNNSIVRTGIQSLNIFFPVPGNSAKKYWRLHVLGASFAEDELFSAMTHFPIQIQEED